jgi:hypothetical protein
MATLQEIDQLKSNWKSDPIWDLYETEGFEEHREELMKYQEECEKEWEEELLAKEEEIRIKAESLGLVGLYKLLLEQEKKFEKFRAKVNNDY